MVSKKAKNLKNLYFQIFRHFKKVLGCHTNKHDLYQQKHLTSHLK